MKSPATILARVLGPRPICTDRHCKRPAAIGYKLCLKHRDKRRREYLRRKHR